jgi:hypothetical protein
MNIYRQSWRAGNNRSTSSGSILIYVLWILVVISVLAFQLASASKVMTVNRSAFANQLKKQMQIESALQFAMFKITSDQWKHKSFELNLNNQKINIRILNESGFVSIYEMGSRQLEEIFDLVGLDQTDIEQIKTVLKPGKKQLRFNSFVELRQFAGVDNKILEQLVPLISIFHEEPVNPRYSSEEVLMLIPGIDQYRVQKLKQATNEIERAQLRGELVELISLLGIEVSKYLSEYYRVQILLDGFMYRVILKYNYEHEKYKVLLINSNTKDLLAFTMPDDLTHQLADNFPGSYLLGNIGRMLISNPGYACFSSVSRAPNQPAILGSYKEFCSGRRQA